MALCDQLEASFTTGGETQGRLVAAVLHGVLETDGREPVRGEKGLELIMEIALHLDLENQRNIFDHKPLVPGRTKSLPISVGISDVPK